MDLAKLICCVVRLPHYFNILTCALIISFVFCNTFTAIQFVLAYDYHQLPPRERQNMLHLSAGFRATTASVEVVFNNEDRRLPVS